MEIKFLDGEAWYNRMPGAEDKDLHVACKYWLSSVSTQIRFEPEFPGINPEPGVMILQLIAETPAACLDQVEESRMIEWAEDVSKEVGEEIREVRIFGPAEASLPVREAS